MKNHLENGLFDVFSIDELQIFLLLFADDTVLFSYSVNGLQSLLDKLYIYCRNWGITVNTNKTVVMLCKNGNRIENFNVYYNNERLDIVKNFVTLSSNGKFFQAQKALAKQASRALFSLNSLFDKVDLNSADKLKLFDSMVLPILNYGSEIWGFHKAPDIEQIHVKFLKQILNLRQQTVNAAVYGELGRYPLYVYRKIRILKYLYKIQSKSDSLLIKAFNMKDDYKNIVNNWSSDVKSLLDSLGCTNM